ncbi:MAG TPA: hypoxanthine phosphoribosyltransferase [Nitrospirota bacterium]|nr:hypoxanthine phosphoribosyltransferase [Nitrospirota bacterium]
MNKIEILKVLIDAATIEKRVGELAGEISRDYAGKDLVLVGILKGAVIFLADLMRRMTIPAAVDFVHASSYGTSTSSSKEVRIKKDVDADVAGRHVLLVDTVVDTGLTLSCLFELFRKRGPASLKAAVLLDKKPCRIVETPLAYRGFEIGDEFVVGYGVDCAEQCRNLPYIAVIKP